MTYLDSNDLILGLCGALSQPDQDRRYRMCVRVPVDWAL
jgi:hypothetical protein